MNKPTDHRTLQGETVNSLALDYSSWAGNVALKRAAHEPG
jgi:hypothetical protein